ncbi:LOW QUALITY PROTEIN: hypothetical protein TorRG33x02_216120 [Trema orientale]|uniref:Uncharacterized protein n=1 Tax=Trema orientale TaxID=63057 RepID=A0A2P5EAN4_TREOI|nr:LOW QUALITY PROTEIN: hypothetical protein TorRG33x02_216120 [Trema orientale]
MKRLYSSFSVNVTCNSLFDLMVAKFSVKESLNKNVKENNLFRLPIKDIYYSETNKQCKRYVLIMKFRSQHLFAPYNDTNTCAYAGSRTYQSWWKVQENRVDSLEELWPRLTKDGHLLRKYHRLHYFPCQNQSQYPFQIPCPYLYYFPHNLCHHHFLRLLLSHLPFQTHHPRHAHILHHFLHHLRHHRRHLRHHRRLQLRLQHQNQNQLQSHYHDQNPH